MTYELRLCNLTKFGNYNKSYTPIMVEDVLLNEEIKERLEVASSNKCIIHVFQDNKDISTKYLKTLGTTLQQAIYNQLNIRVWMKGTGPNNWKITSDKLDDEGIKYQFYTVGD